MSNYIEKEQFEKLNHENLSVVDQGKNLLVNNDASYQLAAELGKEATRREKIVIENFSEPKKASYKAWRAVCELEQKLLLPLQTIKIDLSRKMGRYSQLKEDQTHKEEQMRLAEAKKRQEEEALKRAEELAQNGDKQAAELELEQAIDPVMQPIIAPVGTSLKAEGTSHVTRWQFKIVDEKKIPREYLSVDEKKIRRVVQAMKGDTKIEGIDVYSERTTNFKRY